MGPWVPQRERTIRVVPFRSHRRCIRDGLGADWRGRSVASWARALRRPIRVRHGISNWIRTPLSTRALGERSATGRRDWHMERDLGGKPCAPQQQARRARPCRAVRDGPAESGRWRVGWTIPAILRASQITVGMMSVYSDAAVERSTATALRQPQEFVTRLWIVTEIPPQSARDRRGVLLLHSAHHHAEVGSLDHHTNTTRL